MTLKINTQKYRWPQKPCETLNNKFPGSNWSFRVMWIVQSEFYYKVFVTKFRVFLTRPGVVRNLCFFLSGLRENVPEDRVKSRKCGTCLKN